MKKSLYLTILALAIPAVGGAAGNDRMQETITTMDEVVVTATKTEEKRKDIANSVVLIESEDIEESPAKSVGELFFDSISRRHWFSE